DCVRAARPCGHGPGRYERVAAQRATDHLEVDEAQLAPDLNRLARVALGAIGIAFVEQGESTFAELEPRMLGRPRFALEKPPRPLQPAVGHGRLAAERPAVPREPHPDARRRSS